MKIMRMLGIAKIPEDQKELLFLITICICPFIGVTFLGFFLVKLVEYFQLQDANAWYVLWVALMLQVVAFGIGFYVLVLCFVLIRKVFHTTPEDLEKAQETDE